MEDNNRRKYCKISLKAFFEYMYIMLPFFTKINNCEKVEKKISLKELLNISDKTMSISISGRKIETNSNWRQCLEHVDNPLIEVSSNELTHSLFLFKFLQNTFSNLFPFKPIKIRHQDIPVDIIDADYILSQKQRIKDMVIEKIQYSMCQRKMIKIVYIKRNNDLFGEHDYNILVTSLFKVKNKYYIRAYDYKSRIYKNFILSRITKCEYIEESNKNCNILMDTESEIIEMKFKINPDLEEHVKFFLRNEWMIEDNFLLFHVPKFLCSYLQKELTYKSEWINTSYFVKVE